MALISTILGVGGVLIGMALLLWFSVFVESFISAEPGVTRSRRQPAEPAGPGRPETEARVEELQPMRTAA